MRKIHWLLLLLIIILVGCQQNTTPTQEGMSYDQLITAYPQLIEMQNQATAYP